MKQVKFSDIEVKIEDVSSCACCSWDWKIDVSHPRVSTIFSTLCNGAREKAEQYAKDDLKWMRNLVAALA